MKKLAVALLLLLLLLGGGYLLVRRWLHDPAKLPLDLPRIAKNIEFELENVRYGHTQAGVKKWDLSSLKARRIKGQPEIQLEGVKARIYAQGKLESDTTIEAERGSYVVENGDMVLEGQVRITNPQFQIATRKLLYQAVSGEITAPESLVVDSEKLKIEAARATIEIESQLLHFAGGVKAHLRVDAGASAGASKVPAVPETPPLKPEVESPEKARIEESSLPESKSPPLKKTKTVQKKITSKSKPTVKIYKKD
ncbi:MAG: LPS export ABC transporter periplasmic protein LptC [Deltaproteobacteria bacterium]|nr:LPS export ABC transporter periplasmic protein LptC [Deltaproteobacteria bacterium]